MDSQVKFYRYVVFLMISVSVCLSVYRYLSRGDFLVYARVECNPEEESCFVEPCEEEDCEAAPYKVVTKKAFNIPECNAWAEECAPLSCGEDEPGCEVLECTDENLSKEPNAVCLHDE